VFQLESIGSQDVRLTQQEDAVEVDLTRKLSLPNQTIQPTPAINTKVRTAESKVKSKVLDTTDNSIELVSVASTDFEWTAACGVLAFRSDRACAPRLRMPFCSRNRKVVAADASVRAIREAKNNLRNRQRKEEVKSGKPSCPPVPRNGATVSTPQQVGCCSLILDGSSQSKFFPTGSSKTRSEGITTSQSSVSANQQVPPSKSLSSPFPMQFRERQKSASKIPLVVKTSESTDSAMSSRSSENPSRAHEMETISSPLQAINCVTASPRNNTEQQKTIKAASKGDLPPPCPSATRRKVPVSATTARMRKSKRRLRQLKASKENARSTSVMDLDDDDDDDMEEDERSLEVGSSSTESSEEVDSLVYGAT
jgi:hypothetical protein